MTDKERATEIATNLNNTLKTLKGSVIGNALLSSNNIFAATKASKHALHGKLTRICKRFNINIKDL